jgi:50S ribosomal protein L16 3-hydroxylase
VKNTGQIVGRATELDMKKPLRSLIYPYSTSEFFEHYEGNTPLVIHDLGESIRELTALPFLESLEALLASWPKKVDAYLPGIADEDNSVEITTQEARKYFENGMGLLFNDINIISPVLKKWLDSLTYELGLSSLTYARNLVYATPAGKGTAPHFDQNINFVLQIHGTKKWWIAPNQHVEGPLSRHTIGLPIDPELGSYTKRAMPEQFPDNATEFVLKPGSLLFVPRGAWHKTEALTDALSLNFTLSAPTWIDIVTAALRGRLAQSSEWRETANFVTNKERVHEAMEKLDALLSGLAQDVPNWNAADILGATEAGQLPFE